MMIKQRALKTARLLLYSACVLGAGPVHAQLADDFQLRQKLSVSMSPSKRATIEAGYRLSLEQDASRFNNSMISLSGDYELYKWWKIGGEYRYYMSYEQDRHRFAVFTRLNYKTGKFNLVYRLQFQQTQHYFDREYLQEHEPRRVVRNRVQVKYNYSKKIEFYVFAEPFARWRRNVLYCYRVRYAAGSGYLYKKRHQFNVELFLNDGFGTSNPDDRLIAELGYNFQLIKGKNKAKPAPSN